MVKRKNKNLAENMVACRREMTVERARLEEDARDVKETSELS